MRRVCKSRLRRMMLLAGPVVALCNVSHADPSSPFEAELARLAGRSARQCGLVDLRGDPKPGWQCALQADRDGVAFWFGLRQRGVDSEVWTAAIRTPRGEHIVLSYDSNIFGGRGLHPGFDQVRCTGPIDYRPSEPSPFQCLGTTQAADKLS